MRVSTLFATCALLCGATPAFAQGILVPKGKTAKFERFRTLVSVDGKKQTLIETVEVRGTADKIGWVRAFPSKPSIGVASANVFEALGDLTEVRPPYRTEVQKNLFGPSLVTLISRTIERRRAKPPPPPPAPPRNQYNVGNDVQLFTERAYSSTITRQRELPESLSAWIEEHEFEVEGETKSALMRYCDSGWVLVAQTIKTDRLGGEMHAAIGPTYYRFESEVPVHPSLLFLSSPDAKVPFDYFIVGKGARTPAEFDSVWDEEPWEKEHADKNNTFVARYYQPVPLSQRVEIERMTGGPIADQSHLIGGRMHIARAPKQDMQFVKATSAPPLPPKNSRGSPVDLLLAALLGLAPLLYTPESWFLLWLGARGANDKGSQSLAWMLWPMFSIAVGGFWLITQSGGGRIAAALPILVGLIRLFTGQPKSGPKPVRAKFARRQRTTEPV